MNTTYYALIRRYAALFCVCAVFCLGFALMADESDCSLGDFVIRRFIGAGFLLVSIALDRRFKRKGLIQTR